MCEHTHLSAVVGFVGKHVAQHLRSDGPGLSPSVPTKRVDAARGAVGSLAVERFGKHLRAAYSAFGQAFTDLLRSAVSAVEL